jgi:hypothetical protein
MKSGLHHRASLFFRLPYLVYRYIILSKSVLSQEPVEIQQLVMSLALVMKSAAGSYATIDKAAKRGT